MLKGRILSLSDNIEEEEGQDDIDEEVEGGDATPEDVDVGGVVSVVPSSQAGPSGSADVAGIVQDC